MVFDRLKATFAVQQGIIAQAVVRRLAEEDDLWMLQFELNDGRIEQLTHARKDKPKAYKSLNAALNDAHAVGFKKAIVDMT